ncbi:MAG: prolipoprotein diacylglyceryl transferase [Chryseolinea sp.]
MLASIVWNVSPQVFPFLEIPRWYGLLWCVGLILSYYVMSCLCKRNGQSIATLDTLTLYVITGTLVGARLGHVLFYNPEYYWQHPWEIILPVTFNPGFKFVGYEGLASHGAGIGILTAIFIYSKKYHQNYFRIADDIAIVAALAGGCIRIGNLMNSEMIGLPTDVAWAFVFPLYDDIPRHPAQLYEAIFCFLLFAVLLKLRLSKNHLSPGFLTGIFLVALFTERFINEFFKISQEAFEDQMTLNMGQLLSIPMIIVGGILLFQTIKKSGPTDKIGGKTA